MKCLANWPLSGENSHFPNYRGFEMDVFSVVKDYFVGLRVPLCTYDLFDIFVSAFIKVRFKKAVTSFIFCFFSSLGLNIGMEPCTLNGAQSALGVYTSPGC